MTDGSARESMFTIEATPVKFGAGAAHDAGWEMRRLGGQRVFVVVDPEVLARGVARPVLDSLAAAGLDLVLYSEVETEPSLAALERAVAAARDARPESGAAAPLTRRRWRTCCAPTAARSWTT